MPKYPLIATCLVTSQDMTALLHPQRLLENRNGDLAFAIGRLMFVKGRPMLVEHICGALLMHDLGGRVLTPGYGPAYDIGHVYADDNGL